MKKLLLTIAIVLGMTMGAFAQEAEIEERGLFGKGGMAKSNLFEGLVMPGIDYDETENQDGGETPLGSGIALLMGLGGAYLVAKKRREE